MYKQTLSTTIREATVKLYKTKPDDRISHMPCELLTDAQQECLGEYFFENGFSKKDRDFAEFHLLVNRTDDHLYVLINMDDDDEQMFFYEELIPD